MEYFKTSYMLEQQRKDTLMMIYCLEKQAFAFGDSHFGDSALYYFDKAKSLAETLKILYLLSEYLRLWHLTILKLIIMPRLIIALGLI